MQEPDKMLKELIESELGGGKGAGAVGTGEAKIDSNDSEGVKLAKQGCSRAVLLLFCKKWLRMERFTRAFSSWPLTALRCSAGIG